MLSGLGSASFERGLDGLKALHAVIASRIDKDCAPLSVADQDSEGFSTLRFSNRYFTDGRDAKEQERVAFTADQDPLQVLANIARDKQLFHLQDNVVEYYERVAKGNE